MFLGLDQLLSNLGSDGNGEQKVGTILHPDHDVPRPHQVWLRAVQGGVQRRLLVEGSRSGVGKLRWDGEKKRGTTF